MAIGKTNALKKGVDTSDATATSNDILLGKTAYANDEKIVGIIPTYNNEHENGYVPTRSMKLFLDQTKTCYQLFYNYKGTTIEDGTLEFSDTSNVTNMSYMFYNCSNLTTMPQLDMSNVSTVASMYYGCNKITSLPQLNIDNVKDAGSMCYGCSSLKGKISLSISNATNINSMFRECTNLEEVELTTTEKLEDAPYAFYNCTKLKKASISNTANIDYMNGMFYGCTNITEVQFPNSTRTRNFENMFYGCTNLQTVSLSLSSSQYLEDMFYGCTNLTNLTLTDIGKSLQIGSGTTYGHLLTIDSLVNTCKECINQSSSRTLTVGSANLEKLANVYVKFTNPSQTEIPVGSKGDIVVCESTDAGAMLISNYMALKLWTLA